MLNSLTESLRAGSDLTAEQVTDSVAHMTTEAIPPEAKADFLTALAEKGETADELRSSQANCARVLRLCRWTTPLAPASSLMFAELAAMD